MTKKPDFREWLASKGVKVAKPSQTARSAAPASLLGATTSDILKPRSKKGESGLLGSKKGSASE